MTPEQTQEGIIMFALLVGMVICWGIWLIRFLRKWEREEAAFRKYQRDLWLAERRRLEARNYRYTDS